MKSIFSRAALLLAFAASSAFAQTPAPSNPATNGQPTAEQPRADAIADGVLRHNGMTYFVKNGRAQLVTGDLKLPEGWTVHQDGRVTKKDGPTTTLQNSQMMTLDGQLRAAPGDVNIPGVLGSSRKAAENVRGPNYEGNQPADATGAGVPGVKPFVPGPSVPGQDKASNGATTPAAPNTVDPRAQSQVKPAPAGNSESATPQKPAPTSSNRPAAGSGN